MEPDEIDDPSWYDTMRAELARAMEALDAGDGPHARRAVEVALEVIDSAEIATDREREQVAAGCSPAADGMAREQLAELRACLEQADANLPLLIGLFILAADDELAGGVDESVVLRARKVGAGLQTNIIGALSSLDLIEHGLDSNAASPRRKPLPAVTEPIEAAAE